MYVCMYVDACVFLMQIVRLLPGFRAETLQLIGLCAFHGTVFYSHLGNCIRVYRRPMFLVGLYIKVPKGSVSSVRIFDCLESLD